MRYKIRITEIGQESSVIGKTWKLGAGDTPDDFGYTPEVEATVDVEREIYAQNVDSIDLTSVIKAVNGIQS